MRSVNIKLNHFNLTITQSDIRLGASFLNKKSMTKTFQLSSFLQCYGIHAFSIESLRY
ncbi:hypothetical protein GCM10022405_24060 [Gibbsiella dentisursi]|uniref:Uncharacterized protein n=1 Tax=Gibbsiella dentisursi TaxID=796890 RepID=A0ABP7LAB6_9GAMM